MADVKVGQTYCKRELPQSYNTKSENRDVHSVVQIIRIDDRGVVSLRLVSGPRLFTTRMHVDFLTRDFDLVEEEQT